MNWRKVTLGEICNLVNGKAYNAADWSTEGLPIIRIQNLNDPAKPFNYWNGSTEKEVLVEDGDILLAWSGTPGTSFGAHIWRRGQGVLNQHIFRVDTNRELVTTEWAVTCINHQLHRLIGAGSWWSRFAACDQTDGTGTQHPVAAVVRAATHKCCSRQGGRNSTEAKRERPTERGIV
jgi:type I restriction enzyme S subunit